MKTIKKIKESSKAVAGSALLVGATLAGGAAFATAQSSGSSGDATLGDYPGHFIGEDGTVSSTVVMGEDANAVDVVAGSAIAGQLGNNAFMTETETVSTSGGAVGSFSATNGVTLDTANDNLFFGDTLTEVRDTLSEDQMDALAETTFTDDAGDDTDVEYFMSPGDLELQFGKPDDRDNEDPIHYIENPADPTPTEHLYELQATFEDVINFTNEDVQDEEIELFGNTYTVSTDTQNDELILFGGQDSVSVDSGESTTMTVGGEEVTVEVVAVTSSDTAAYRVNGELNQDDEDQEFTVNGEDVRLQDVIQTNSDNSQGVVTFAVGSEELTIDPSGDQVEDSDGDDVEGLYAEVAGGDAANAQGINFYVGAQDDDREYLAAGESYAHDFLRDFTVHYEGLNPDTTSGDAEGVSQVEFESSGDDTVTVSMDGESVEFLHAQEDSYDSSTQVQLRDSDDDVIHSYEGAVASEDEYFAADAGDFPHLFEVTNIDRDETGDSIESGSEATVDLRDAVTGDTVEVDLDAATTVSDGDFSDNGGGEYYADTEIIDGQTYKFVVEGDDSAAGDTNDRDSDTLQGNTGEPELQVVFGDGSKVAEGGNVPSIGDNLNPGDEISNYAALDTDSNAAVSLYQVHNPVMPFTSGKAAGDTSKDVFDGRDSNGDPTSSPLSDVTADSGVTVEVPSTESTDKVTQEVTLDQAAAFTTNGGLRHTFGFVPLEMTESGSHIDLSQLGTPQIGVTPADGDKDESFEFTLLFADGTTEPVTVDNDGDTALDTTDITDSGKTLIGISSDSDGTALTTGDTVSVADGGSVDTTLDDTGDVDVAANNAIYAFANGDQLMNPAAFTIEPENDNDEEEAYVVGASPDTGDDELDVSFGGFTGDSRQTATLESNDDIDVGVDLFGTYSEIDNDEQGSVTLNLPSGQAVAGVGVTSEEGEVTAGGSGGSGTVETMTPTGFSSQYTALDSDSSVSSAKQERHLVLVGGPAVNSVVGELVEANETMAGSEYTEGQGMLQLVEDAFTEGHDALIVAGHSGEDTRAAGEFLVNHDENSDALEGSTQVTVNTAEGTVVQ
ncbi:S-layer protein [Nanohaloarchaea archaeon H01]|nr:S-layer protein [Nanohaloarchaea archaeon H01]